MLKLKQQRLQVMLREVVEQRSAAAAARRSRPPAELSQRAGDPAGRRSSLVPPGEGLSTRRTLPDGVPGVAT